MKKFMVMALMAVAASSAFAQGDALKSILKAKSHAPRTQENAPFFAQYAAYSLH